MGPRLHRPRTGRAGILGAQRLPHVRRPLEGAALLGQLSPAAVVFDVGYTIVDERRSWHAWADWAGIDRGAFMDTLGEIAREGRDHREIFDEFGIDPDGGPRWRLGPEDLYPDAVPCLQRLAAAGYRLGVAGNQPAATEGFFEGRGVVFEVVGSSQSWGVAKPDHAFFTRIADELWLAPREIVYVGDRLDNDVLPAIAVGLRAVLVARGPWGEAHASDAGAGLATVIDTLDRLPGAIGWS